ncbi:MAG TPA: IS4 family transposase [bacterium]|nr:IS4 family transposase [bacterium]
MAPRGASAVRINLAHTLELLHTHITAALCQTVFATVRTTERQRAWTLDALVQFWLAVILRAPKALSHALAEALDGTVPLVHPVPATPEAFFQRCRDLRPAFFAAVFAEFTRRLLPRARPTYAGELAALQARFAAVLVVDGSTLAAIAHRLKLLWPERTVILPGCLLGLYDLGRGLCRGLGFAPDAAAAELPRAVAALPQCPRDALLVGDRLYCAAAWFRALTQHGCWGLVRRNRPLGLRRLRRLRQRRYRGGRLEEWLVAAGARDSVVLRHIRWHRGRTAHELLTNVLDPQRLPAVEALALYPARWTIERMYYDLKEVLNLNRVYAANPNAIAMQLYAAACVYNAVRVAQAQVAAAARLAPEALSPAKLFPRVAAACQAHAVLEWSFGELQRANPGRRLRRPVLHRQRFASVALATIRVEPRTGPRRRPGFYEGRPPWKSLAHVRGARKVLKLT